MTNKEITELPTVYETDNLEAALYIRKNHPGIGVVYHDTSKVPTPFLNFKIEGRIYTKYNPDYIAYLKREFPSMDEQEIIDHMQNLYQANGNKKTR